MNLQYKSKKSALLLAGILFLLFNAAPLLHNHTPNIAEPATCPAHILQITMQSAGAAFALAIIVPLQVSRYNPAPLQSAVYSQDFEHDLSSRAPPSII